MSNIQMKLILSWRVSFMETSRYLTQVLNNLNVDS